MNIQITYQIKREDGSKFFQAVCEKVSAWVSINKDGSLQVCCQNAANRAWKGSGRGFVNPFEAQAAYKSAEMKAIIRAAVAL